MDSFLQKIRKRRGFSFRDFYDLLGVSRDASVEEIKKAYRKQALRYHPDRNRTPEAEERFRTLKEAYDTLSDPEKRRRYNMWIESGMSFALYRVWQQARDNRYRYRTAAYRRRKASPRNRFKRESLTWLVNILLVSMICLSLYVVVISVDDLTTNGYKAEHVQAMTFSTAFMVLLVYLGFDKHKRRKPIDQ